ncbi:hypothetical protein AJ80_07429 [Polytolypa hystricis UAMH7299]|uniref:Poly(A) RNA polymerase mitochondrial-like central palm domain-containing protein n=1 Tax=Polytolypa hystricis (strain UAMH7299) TaxID=1447883 RepID=A0A2B7XPI3_POLH7|nr:hypothetical protein AJ80_07429 [Polytolypa hystricis UAMH7299]
MPSPRLLCPQCLLDGGIPESGRIFLRAGRFRRPYHATIPRRSQVAASHPEINPDSLTDTLERHRYKNRQQIIRRIAARAQTPWYRLDLPQNEVSPAQPDDNARPRVDLQFPAESASQPPGAQAEFAWDLVLQSELPADLEQVSKEPVTLPGPESADKKSEKAGTRRKHRNQSQTPQPFQPYEDNTKPKLCWKVDEQGGQHVQYPWLDYLEGTGEDGISRLQDEIQAFETYMSLLPQEEAACGKVQRDTNLAFKKAGLKPPFLIGSRRTGMGVRHSDVDFLLQIKDPDRVDDDVRGPSPTRPKMLEEQEKHLTSILDCVKSSFAFTNASLIRAKVPIVAATHDATGLPIQFQCATSVPSSIYYILNYQAEFPTIRTLFVTVRMLLETHGLFGAINGSVGSYGLTMMVVAALKIGEGNYARDDIVRQLLHFLTLYKDLDTTKHGVALEPPGLFSKINPGGMIDKKSRKTAATTQELEQQHQQKPSNKILPYLRGQRSIAKRSQRLGRPDILCLQDPANFMNDLGATCVYTREVQMLFAQAHEDLTAAIKAWDGEWSPTTTAIASDNSTITPSSSSSSTTTTPDKPTNATTDTKSPYTPTASLISRTPNPTTRHQQLSLLHFALGANYEDLERVRDKIILTIDVEDEELDKAIRRRKVVEEKKEKKELEKGKGSQGGGVGVGVGLRVGVGAGGGAGLGASMGKWTVAYPAPTFQ